MAVTPPPPRSQIDAKIDEEVGLAEAFLHSGGVASANPEQMAWFAAAQVHATLALVAAVRQNTARTARRS